MSILDKLNQSKSITLSLENTTNILNIQDINLRRELTELYDDKNNKLSKYLASIVNACVTKDLPCFMMSRNIVMALILQDENIQSKDKPMKQRHYGQLLKVMLETHLFELVYKPSKVGVGTKRAGLYRVKDAELRSYFNSNIKSREQSIVKEYYKYQKITLNKALYPEIFAQVGE